MKTSAWFLSLSLAVGCAGTPSADHRPDEGTPGVATTPSDATNTRLNERDRAPGAITPTSQGENSADLAITQQIRQDVMKSGDLSMAAKNVKIITIGGVVTLRGPVKSPQESTEIADIAQRAAGVKQVDNQLEVSAG